MAGKKHSEDDDQHGVPKFVQRNWQQAVRKKLAQDKRDNAKRKASDKDGKGKR